MNSIPCDLVLLPSKGLADKAIKSSNLITNEYESFFTLEVGKFYPHMSLYMFQLNEAGIANVKDALANISKNLGAINATATNYCLGGGFSVGYVDVEYEVSDKLRSLQNNVIKAINPLRSGMRESDIKKMQDATGLKLENLQKYGYPSIGDLFRPHITLTRTKEHTPQALDLLPSNIEDFNGIFDRIGLFGMGTNGTCISQIAIWNLEK